MKCNMNSTEEQKLLEYIAQHGIVRSQEVRAHGWAATYLQRLEESGLIKRVSRGLYTLQNSAESGQSNLALVCKRAPEAVVCLLSALRFHDITTQLPFEVWIAIGNKSRRPLIEYPPIRLMRFSGPALTQGIEHHLVDGVSISVYSAAKTVADCFKYRNKIGLDVAIEALKECRKKQLASVDEIWHYATVCRVTKVMQPYIQAIG